MNSEKNGKPLWENKNGSAVKKMEKLMIFTKKKALTFTTMYLSMLMLYFRD